MLGLQNMEVLEETKDGEGIGEVGYLPAATTVTALVVLIKEKFDLKNVILYGNPNDTVEKIAICPGSGKSVINEAVQKKADCLITGDIGHHEGLDANEMGLTILDASHYGLEHIFMHIMYEYLKGYCMDVEIGIADVGVPFSILYPHLGLTAFQARKASGCKMQAHTSAYSPAYARVQIP